MENPVLIHKVPLHDVKNGVQYAEFNWGIMGPVFLFFETINLHWYVTHIVTPFLYYKRSCALFQHDSATAEAINISLYYLQCSS